MALSGGTSGGVSGAGSGREKLLESIVMLTPSLVLHADRLGRVDFANRAPNGAESDTGGRFYLGLKVADWFGNAAEAVETAFARALASGGEETVSVTESSPSGRRWLTVRVHPQSDGAIVVARDETKLARSNSIMAARLRILSAYATKTLDEILVSALNEAEALTGSEIGFLHHLAEDQKTLTLQVWSSKTTSHYCKAVGKGLHYSVDLAGVWVDCIRQRKPVIHNDYEKLPNKAGVPAGHAKLVRELVVPVFRDGLIVAILGVGNKETEYSEEDVEIVQLIADLSWDVTERKRVEEKLAKSEARSRMAESAGKVGIFEWDIKANASEWSDTLWELYGLAPGACENPSSIWEKLVLPEDLPKAKRRVERAIETRQTKIHGAYRIVRQSDKAVRWLENDGIIVYGEDGGPTRMYGSCRDVTELHEALDTLKGRDRLLTEAQRATHMGVYDLDIHAGVFEASTELEAIFGVSPEYPHTVEGWLSLVADEDREKMAAHFAVALASGAWFDMEYRIRRPSDGAVVWVYGTGEFIPGADGKPARMVGTIQDISRRKSDEAERGELMERLARARNLESLGTLAGGIAHDFNNILSSILGYTQLAIENPYDVMDLRENLEMVLEGAGRAKELVRQMLAFSTRGAGEKTLARLDLVVGEAIKLLRETTPENIKITSVCEDPLTVCVDLGQLHRAVLNICSNAIAAMSSSGGSLTITLGVAGEHGAPQPPQDLPRGKYALVTFTDTGEGISPSILPRIFDPFFTTRHPGKGAGLGLSTAHSFVTGAGGTIEASSQVGRGATFRVFLPLATSAHECEEPRPAETTLVGAGRVLLVDDEPSLVKIVRKMLAHFGFTPVEFTSSFDALDAFKNDPQGFVAVVTDQMMPGLSGIELSTRIRELNPTVPIVISTGYSDEINQLTLEALSIDGLLHKPVEMAVLGETLRRVLQKSK